MKPIKHITISMLLFLNSITSQTLDTTFGTNGIVVTDLTSQVDAIGDLVVRDNGKILASGIGGSFISLTQYLSDGTLDNSFGTSGKLITNYRSGFMNGAFSPIAIQTDGKILLCVNNNIQNVNNFVLARYNSNGTSLDTTFGTNGIVNNNQFNGFGNARSITDMDLLSNGKILVTVNNYNQILLYRFNSNGTLDFTFGLNGISTISAPLEYTNFYPVEASINTDGIIVLLTTIADSLYSDMNYAVVQLNSEGILNSNFGNNGIVIGDLGTTQYDQPTTIIIQDNGKIIVSGYTSTSSNGKFVVVRHKADGSLDTTFNTTGITSVITGGPYRTAADVLIDSNGKIVVGGSIGDDFACWRLNDNGTIDTSFGLNGIYKKDLGNSSYDYGTQISQQSDGKYIIAGYTSFFCSDRAFGLTRISSNQSLNNDAFENIDKTVKIYPNPTSSIINIESDFTINSIELYDMQGRNLETRQMNETRTAIDISTKSNGVYFLKIKTDHGSKVMKIIKN